MYSPQRVPLEVSQIPSYLERELRKLAGEVNGYETKNFIPQWFGAGGNPSIGNGSLSMRYRIGNDLVELWLRVIMGSTTTYGTGEWSFEVPDVAKLYSQFGVAHFLDSGTSRYAGSCEVLQSSSVLRLFSHGVLNSVRSTVPFTWAAGDELHAHVRYIR